MPYITPSNHSTVNVLQPAASSWNVNVIQPVNSSWKVDAGPITHPNYTTACINTPISAVSNETIAIPAGVYVMSSDITCFYTQGSTPQTATTSGHALYAGAGYKYVEVANATNNVFGAITAGGEGVLKHSKIGEL